MPYDIARPGTRRIAVIGGGITGLGAAHRLAGRNAVTLFEAAPRLGGHACTVRAGKRGDQPVDIGFIVFNRANYPNLCALFDELGVPVAPSRMTFGTSIDGGRIEYALRDLNGLFAQRRNLVRPGYWRMLRDVLRFNAQAHRFARDDSMTVRDLLRELGTGAWFRDCYLLPFSGAIWSTPTGDVLDFPAAAMIRFFQNHNLLNITGQHQWFTVAGGSVEYVRRLEASLLARGTTIRTATPIAQVRRDAAGVDVRPVGSAPERFDEVIFATHSDDSYAMLADPSTDETEGVGRIGYQSNEIVLHADPAVMPRRRAAWASWVYTEDSAAHRRDGPIELSYWMNSLQPIPADDPLFVTLNSRRAIRAEHVHHRTIFRHPVYDTAALRAQARVQATNGTRNTWFCGAWLRNGFHEDGLATGYEVADALMARAERTATA